MKSEFPTIKDDKPVSPHAQEVECALILSQMINKVKEDPSQMRLAIYEFARTRLQIDTSWADEAERKRLSDALETAIDGVEAFSARQDERERLQLQAAAAPISHANQAESPSTTIVPIHPAEVAPKAGVAAPEKGGWRTHTGPVVVDVQARTLIPSLGRLSIAIAIFVVAVGLIYSQRSPTAWIAKLVPSSAKPAPQHAPAAPEVKTAAVSPSRPPFPLPSEYGVYALSDTGLSELHLLTEHVPDKRISISTPMSEPTATTVADGKVKFLIFRRDFAANPPDRMEVRVVAKVIRAVTFDSKGKPNFSLVSDAWNIRNLSYEFRVRPVPGNSEMVLIQAENADVTLPAGRYILVVRNEGYDFTVAGKVTDPSQCLERTDAANGSFYSGCEKR
jgi:hypothetical protein